MCYYLSTPFQGQSVKYVKHRQIFIVKKVSRTLQLQTGVDLHLEEMKWLTTNKGVSILSLLHLMQMIST